MADVFISHVDEDAQIAESFAKGLEDAGFTTWLYERDSEGGPSYLLQIANAIHESRAVLLLISRDSLGSNQVTNEVIMAHEGRKPFVPILIDIRHEEFQNRQPEWRAALGAATSLPLKGHDISVILPRVIAGLHTLLGAGRTAPQYGLGQPKTVQTAGGGQRKALIVGLLMVASIIGLTTVYHEFGPGQVVPPAPTPKGVSSISASQSEPALSRTKPAAGANQPQSTYLPLNENFEAGLGSNWVINDEQKAYISTDFAHSGKQSLKITYLGSPPAPRATLRFPPQKACTIEFWIYILDRGIQFSGWDNIGFGWEPLAEAEGYERPVFVDLLWDNSIEGMTTQEPPSAVIDLSPRSSGEVFLWTLTQRYPVEQWFSVRMTIHANRNVEFLVGDNYAGTISGDTTESIERIEFGGGLSLQAMDYQVYIDDLQIIPLQEDVSP
jgi:hypothetical protein